MTIDVAKTNVYAVVGPDPVQVPKANVYAVKGSAAVEVPKAHVYAVTVAPRVEITKANVYAVIAPAFETEEDPEPSTTPSTGSTLSPFRFLPGTEVIVEDYQEVLEQWIHSMISTLVHYAGGFAAAPDWDDEDGRGGDKIGISSTIGDWVERYRWTIVVDPDVQLMRLSIEAKVAASGEIEARILIDGDEYATITAEDTHNGTRRTVDFDAPTPGVYTCTLELRRNAGDVTSTFVWWSHDQAPTPVEDLPEPSG